MKPKESKMSRYSYPVLAITSAAGVACVAEEGRSIDEPTSTGQLLAPPSSQSSGAVSGVNPASGPNTEDPGTDSAVPEASSTTGFGTDSNETTPVQPPIFDIGGLPDVGSEHPDSQWLVHFSSTGGELHLFQIDIATAATTDLCVVVDPNTSEPLSGWSTTSTFTRDDRLLFTHMSTHLYELELPSCHAIEIGPIGYDQVNGIAPDEGDNLFGITGSADLLLRIDAQTGAGVTVGSLGTNWAGVGGTWNDDEQQIYGVNGLDDALFTIDRLTGTSTLEYTLPILLGSVGMEYHPLTRHIYICTDDAHLYRIEDDRSVTDIGPTGLNGCNNLGAPWLPDVPLPAI